MSVFTNSASSAPEQASRYVGAILDLLGNRNPMDVLRQTPEALDRTLDGLAPDQVGRPEAAGKWSVRQVLQHLADSELVWGYRVRMILAHDRPKVTGYDQDLWATRLHYEEADPRAAVQQFSVLRQSNLVLVGRASDSDRRRVAIHDERGEESVEHLVRLNAGHDLLHLRQIDRIRAALKA